MFAGVAGLRSHQTMMDVVGNNISNVNTAGYKSSRVTFQEALTQVVRGATAPGDGQGGVNPMQMGLGTRVGAIDGVFGQGATQLTGRATDLAIQGEGFFNDCVDGEDFYTRAGAFSWDSNGSLVGPQGEQVVGTDGNPVQVDVTAYRDVSIGADGTITGRNDAGEPIELGAIRTATFTNPNGLTRVGGSMFTQSVNSGAPTFNGVGEEPAGAIQAGTLEMSNVDLAQEFTNLILAQRGFQANSRVITASDELLSDLVNIKR